MPSGRSSRRRPRRRARAYARRGVNGAEKSTAIKRFVGELKPEAGTTWRHADMRLTYVARHAFHHLEKRLDKTAVQYTSSGVFSLRSDWRSSSFHGQRILAYSGQRNPARHGQRSLQRPLLFSALRSPAFHGQRILNMQRAA